MEPLEMNRLLYAAALTAVLSGCATLEFGDKVAQAGQPVKARIEFVDPAFMFRTRLTEARLDLIACTFESLDREANRQLRTRLFESLVTTLPSQRVGFEPRNKLVFYFEDGKVETLVFSGRSRNGNPLDAEWQGLGAQVVNALPAELARFVGNAHLAQLNPKVRECAFLGRE
jgi:hypothetical protein